MNDMLEMYPHDKHLLYLAGNWLMGENGNDQAQRIMEKALAIDKNFPAALNDLAYVDARNRQFDKAFAAMDRYVALLPKEPNPQDSYGELLRMAGNFEGSLAALSRRAQDRSRLRDFATRPRRHLRSDGQSGAGPRRIRQGHPLRPHRSRPPHLQHAEGDDLRPRRQLRRGRQGLPGDRRDRARQGTGPAGSAGAAPDGGVSDRRQRRPEASEAGRGISQPSLDDFRLGSRRGDVAHSPQPRRAGRPRRQSAAGRPVAASTRGSGQRQPQPRDPEFLSRRGRTLC